jgi:FkbM family methyltransferase
MDVVLRTYSSDPDVFKQVFIDKQYDLPVPMERVRTLLDGGANVGLSTLYFLMRCPNAFVLALEPDPENYRYAIANTRVFASRVRMLPMALWSREGQLDLVRGDAAWASSVRMSESPSLPVEGISIAGALQLCGWSQVDLIKLDIEGAEVEVLDAATPNTIHQGKCWAIELHSERARNRFEQLFRPPEWCIDTHGEISVAMPVS